MEFILNFQSNVLHTTNAVQFSAPKIVGIAFLLFGFALALRNNAATVVKKSIQMKLEFLEFVYQDLRQFVIVTYRTSKPASATKDNNYIAPRHSFDIEKLTNE